MRAESFWSHQRVLVVAPHPDDETFGCGGLIAKVKAAGGQVFVMVASIGDLHHYGAASVEAATLQSTNMRGAWQPESHEPLHDETRGRVLTLVSGNQRAAELAAAMAELGVDGYEVLFTDSYTHMRLDTVPIRDLIGLIERDARYAIDKIVPTALIMPGCSYNQDHEMLFKAAFAACRPHLAQDKPFVPLVLSSDGPQLAWSYRPFHPNFYVDITPFLEKKIQAHACHQSQLKAPPHHASLENLERLARLRGAEISVQAAEAFECHRAVW